MTPNFARSAHLVSKLVRPPTFGFGNSPTSNLSLSILGTNHPTIHSAEQGLLVLERFSADFTAPTPDEGFDRIKSLPPHPSGSYTKEEIQAILDSIRDSPPCQSSASEPLNVLQFFRGSGHLRGGHSGSRLRSASPQSNSSQRGMRNNAWNRGYNYMPRPNVGGGGRTLASPTTNTYRRAMQNDGYGRMSWPGATGEGRPFADEQPGYRRTPQGRWNTSPPRH